MASEDFWPAYDWLNNFTSFLVHDPTNVNFIATPPRLLAESSYELYPSPSLIRDNAPLLSAAIKTMLKEVYELRAERVELLKEIENLKAAVALHELIENGNHVIIRSRSVAKGQVAEQVRHEKPETRRASSVWSRIWGPDDVGTDGECE
jgi:hypothetical protein